MQFLQSVSDTEHHYFYFCTTSWLHVDWPSPWLLESPEDILMRSKCASPSFCCIRHITRCDFGKVPFWGDFLLCYFAKSLWNVAPHQLSSLYFHLPLQLHPDPWTDSHPLPQTEWASNKEQQCSTFIFSFLRECLESCCVTPLSDGAYCPPQSGIQMFFFF